MCSSGHTHSDSSNKARRIPVQIPVLLSEGEGNHFTAECTKGKRVHSSQRAENHTQRFSCSTALQLRTGVHRLYKDYNLLSSAYWEVT